MSQTPLDFPSSPLPSNDFIAMLTEVLHSLASCRSGTNAPVDVQQNEIWILQPEDTDTRTVYVHIGEVDVEIGTVEDGKFSAGVLLASSINDTNPYAVPNATTVRDAINNMAGASTIPVHFVGEVQDFLLTQPRAGFVQAAGQVLNNADVDYPEAWAEATKADPSLLMCTAEERATMIAARDAASPYKVGGVPYWTVDTANKTLTVPDLRTDFARAGDTKAGNWHGDAIRQLKVDSILYEFRGGGSYTLNSGNVQVEANINIPIIGSPTALENRPRAYSVLRCVCVNPSLASRLEPTSTSNGLVYAVDESKDYSDPLNQRPNVFTTPAQASNAGMPSNRYYDIFDSSITAIADGFAIFRLNGSGTIPAHTRFVITTNSSYAETGGINGYTAISRLLPKGMTMKLSVLTDPSATIRFFYAQGAYVDGMPQDNPKYPTY